MIYKNNYFNRELKEAFIDKKISNKNMLLSGLFLGLISFAIYFLFQSMTGSVLSDVLPSIMSPSYFATLYLYINLATAFFVAHTLWYFDSLTFSEMRKSKWYALIKVGKNPTKMIVSKILARFVNTFLIYTLGFLVTLLMTSVLNYKFVIFYILPLYLSGLIQITFILFVMLFLSLISRRKNNARLAILFSVVVIFVVKCLSGYYKLEADRILMQSIDKMAVHPYFITIICLCVMVFVATMVYAKKHCGYLHRPSALDGKIAVEDTKTNKIVGTVKHKKTDIKWLGIVGNSVAIAILVIALGLNIFVLVMSSDIDGVKQIGGKLPYIFSSSTMSPIIEKNDLAYFKKIDNAYELKVGDVIMFKDENVTYVEKILEISDKILVDIVAYPPNSAPDGMKKLIDRGQVEAIHVGNNRALGAVIMFANSTVGRVILLILPLMFLFFNKSLVARLFKRKQNEQNDEEEFFEFDNKSAVIVDDVAFLGGAVDTLDDIATDSDTLEKAVADNQKTDEKAVADNKKTDEKAVANNKNTDEKAVADCDTLEKAVADIKKTDEKAVADNDTPDDVVADIKKTDANKLLIYTANITRDFVVDGNTSVHKQQSSNPRRKYSDIISIHKGVKIFADDKIEVYRKLNRSRLIDLYNSGVFSGSLEYRRLVDKNVFHYVLTEYWLYKDDFTGDIMALFNLYDINTEYLSKIELMHKAEFDVLTSVYNRVSAEQKIKAYLENKENAGLDVAFMISDIDGLIKINENFGHSAGDKALCDVANLASKIFADNSVVARVGGDEFAIFVSNIKDKKEVCDCAAKFVNDVSKIGVGKDATKCATISLGLCFSKVEDCHYSVLYEQADEALMVAKRTGRNKVYEFGSTDCDDGIDKITGKIDYKSFKIKAKRLIEANPTANIVVLFSDIDNFKMINHIYGFAKGDELLRKYSDYLKEKASIDFARTNVDKFVGICLESTAEYEKIFNNMQYNDDLTSLLDLDYPAKRTLGAYQTKGDNFSKSIEEMIELAGLASKELQATSKRSWTVFDDRYVERRTEENKYEAIMEDALKNGEFLMYLQPQLNLKENKTTGCEALVRWQISKDEIVQPANFIDLFEKNGFIRELDKFMFDAACQKIRKWIDSGKKPLSIAINVSQKDILSRTFISDYVGMKEKYNIPDGLLEVEFSESIIVENESLMINILEEFKKHGIRTAIDDFGAGYTSLNILNYACVDTLKIDRGFFVECKQCERKRLVVESIVKMAKVLGMSVVAEGIEKKKQMEFLSSIDCDYLQGYFIDKPLPADVFENKYLK